MLHERRALVYWRIPTVFWTAITCQLPIPLQPAMTCPLWSTTTQPMLPFLHRELPGWIFSRGIRRPSKKGMKPQIYPRVIKLGRLESPLKSKNGGFIPGKMIYEREQLQQATFDYRRVGCFVIQFPSMTPPDWTSCAVSLDHVWTKTRSPI